ncbi:efflux RND transporter periplasmic adaptor subunit [Planctomycetota bacterium]
MRAIQVIVLSVLIVSAAVSCRSDHEEQKKINYKVQVETLSAARVNLRNSIRCTGTAEPFKKITVSTRLQGQIGTVLCRKGDTVSESEVLAELDAAELILNVKQAKSKLTLAKKELEKVRSPFRKQEIEQVKAQLERADAAYKEAKADRIRAEKLVKNGSISPADFDKITMKEKTAKAQVTSVKAELNLMEEGARAEDIAIAEAHVEQAQDSLALAAEHLSWASVKAPLKGVISDTYVEKGEWVRPGMPLFELIVYDRVIFNVSVSESEISSIKSDTACEAVISSLKNKKIKAEIKYIDVSADSVNRNFGVEVVVDNKDRSIRIGMLAEIIFYTKQYANVIAIPRESVVMFEGKKGCFTVKEGKAQFRKLDIGDMIGDLVIINNGLSDGEEIIVLGASGLKPGDSVSVPEKKLFEKAE